MSKSEKSLDAALMTAAAEWDKTLAYWHKGLATNYELEVAKEAHYAAYVARWPDQKF